MERAKYLTLILSIAVAKTIRKLGLDSKVKWPNDVLVKDKKICGILTETISGKENYALVGIGFNVNNKKFPKSIIKKTTSLKIETNEDFNIKKILGMIIGNFNSLYKYYKNNNYGKIISIWKKYSHTLGRKVKVNTLSGIFIGEAIDIDTNCNLILKLKNGKIKKVIEGDIFIS